MNIEARRVTLGYDATVADDNHGLDVFDRLAWPLREKPIKRLVNRRVGRLDELRRRKSINRRRRPGRQRRGRRLIRGIVEPATVSGRKIRASAQDACEACRHAAPSAVDPIIDQSPSKAEERPDHLPIGCDRLDPLYKDCRTQAVRRQARGNPGQPIGTNRDGKNSRRE